MSDSFVDIVLRYQGYDILHISMVELIVLDASCVRFKSNVTVCK